ncbi:hypothetical protein R3W88_000374 [Solanum pinnatisectum]|uniref:Uncharacterized protein n=1 Tax=Solanum pinnatisectum TaxID=50273 RepID=A0AAV9MIV9_9SOLN|nr:hypothetical protein R3W88_000374 [Solanum pinnatisectum]
MQSEQKKKNKGRNSKLPIKGVDADDHAQQGVPNSIANSSNLIDFIAMSLEKIIEENCKKTLQNERSKECSQSQKEKEQQESFEEEALEKQQQKEGESNYTLMEESIDNLNKEIIPENVKIESLFDLCEVAIQIGITEERDGSKTTKDQEDSIQEKLSEQQQQQQDIIGETELNKVTSENEYNWNLRRGNGSWEDSSMKKEDSSNKKYSGGKRKCREN